MTPEENRNVENSNTDKHERDIVKIDPEKRIWGFEGCGIMWNFYLDEDEARRRADDRDIVKVTLEEGYDLDNARRQEMGFKEISREDFKRILLDDRDPSET